ncbi:hypothetical protein NMG60_11024225 [Bertholletia excelsa]
MAFTTEKGRTYKSGSLYDEEQLRKLFMKHDINKDNRLSKEEIKNAFNELGALFPSWRAQRALAYADKDGSGYIEEHEMKDLIRFTLNLGYTVN